MSRKKSKKSFKDVITVEDLEKDFAEIVKSYIDKSNDMSAEEVIGGLYDKEEYE